MQKIFTLNLRHMLKKSAVCATLLLSVVVIALASSGGGKRKAALPNPVFTPIRATGAFTLKCRTDYAGSLNFSRKNDQHFMLYRSVVTYQKGNAIYVLPSSYKVSYPSKLSFRNNLNALDLKINLTK